MLFGSLLPDPAGLGWGHVHIANDEIGIELHTTVPTSACPLCGQMSGRVHSHYTRTLGDLPWHGRSVRLVLSARRFFCDYASCQRRIFVERIPRVSAAYARRTRRLDEALLGIAFACGGEAGARLAHRLSMSTSPDTLLRCIRHCPEPPSRRLRAVGIDDWAVRRGQRYGTIVCDLDGHCPVDVLDDRESQTVAAWLARHPEIEVITRDRAGFYIEGASTGAPQAMQVADRFHLIQNLREALLRMLERRHQHLLSTAREVAQTRESSAATPTLAKSPRAPPQRKIPRRPSVNEIRRALRTERYEQVVVLHAQGVSQRTIAKRVGLNRATVARYLHAGTLPPQASRTYATKTDPFVDYLRTRWAEGCHNAAQLARELRTQGFTGSDCSVRRRVVSWDRSVTGRAPPSTKPPGVRPPSARRLSWLFLKDPGDRSEREREFVDALFQCRPELERAASLARAFADMMRERRGEELDAWIRQAWQTNVPREIGVFATGLNKDYKAVKAALTTEWSNGQVEGQVNRLKLLKRQMYGRAKFNLLRRRVLHTG